jgi:hypothetical protein
MPNQGTCTGVLGESKHPLRSRESSGADVQQLPLWCHSVRDHYLGIVVVLAPPLAKSICWSYWSCWQLKTQYLWALIVPPQWRILFLLSTVCCAAKSKLNLCFIEFFWEQWRDISKATLASKKIFLMPWPQLMHLPFRSGKIGWYDGWMLTEKERAPRRPRFRWRSLAAANSLHIVEYMSRLLKYLIRLFRYTKYGIDRCPR